MKLKKGGATPGSMHEVDAISGGTKTSDGVSAMLYNSLTAYLPFLTERIAAQAPAQAEETVRDEELSNELNATEDHE